MCVRRRALVGGLATAGLSTVAGTAIAAGHATAAGAARGRSPVLHRGDIADPAPTAASHASTLAQASDGTLLAAWFGGSAERAPDVRTWVARHDGRRWGAPQPVADGGPWPTWNPVLCQPAHGPLLLFDKAGPDPQHWWGRAMTSDDGGRRWSAPRRLPDGVLGPARSKPLQLPDGSLLSPSSTEATDGTWRLHMERCDDRGTHWQRGDDIDDPAGIAAIQPSLALRPDGSVLAFARSKAGRIAVTASADGGRSWEPLALTALPNPNAGVEVLGLADGRLLMVFNPRTPGSDWWTGRDRLDLAVSADGGRRWRHALTLEDQPGQEFSYPAAIQTRDGRVHLSYTARRTHIRHVVVDPARLG